MKKELLNEIIEKKKKKVEFSVITNLLNGESCIYEKNKTVHKNFIKYEKEINHYFNKKKNGILNNTNIFVENYIKPIKVVIIGAVHIAQYLLHFVENLNFEVFIIDPRGYFASRKRFPNVTVINKWPKEAFAEIQTAQPFRRVTTISTGTQRVNTISAIQHGTPTQLSQSCWLLRW